MAVYQGWEVGLGAAHLCRETVFSEAGKGASSQGMGDLEGEVAFICVWHWLFRAGWEGIQGRGLVI